MDCACGNLLCEPWCGEYYYTCFADC
jgi:hypothetical protein